MTAQTTRASVAGGLALWGPSPHTRSRAHAVLCRELQRPSLLLPPTTRLTLSPPPVLTESRPCALSQTPPGARYEWEPLLLEAARPTPRPQSLGGGEREPLRAVGHRLRSHKWTSHGVLAPAAQFLVSPGASTESPALSMRVLRTPVTHTGGLPPWPAGSGSQPRLPRVHGPWRGGAGTENTGSVQNTILRFLSTEIKGNASSPRITERSITQTRAYDIC